MTNKEKAKKLGYIYSRQYHHNTYPKFSDNSEFVYSNKEVEAACIEMAEWKEQQAIEYLYKNIQSLLKDYGVSEASTDIATQLFLANFKQAMEE